MLRMPPRVQNRAHIINALTHAFPHSPQPPNDSYAMRMDNMMDDSASLEYSLLGAQCYSKSNRPDDVCRVVDSVFGNKSSDEIFDELNSRPESTETVLALLCLEKGKALDSQDNRLKALEWLKLALHLDVRCVEALERISAAQSTPIEESRLLDSLKRNGAFSSINKAWLEPIITCSLNKHDCSAPSDLKFITAESISAQPPTPAEENSSEYLTLAEDTDILALKAEARYYQRDARGAYEITRKIVESDRSNPKACLVHVASLVALNKASNLFYFAHLEVKERPGSASSWYAVGAYYYCSKQYEKASMYMQKATNTDPGILEAWMGLAHARAAQDESDRALATYRTALRLFPGSHYPCVGIAMEYLRTSKIDLAEQFCRLALSFCDVDPAVFNEMGVVHFKAKRFDDAAMYFEKALSASRGLNERSLSIVYETTMFNLGHALRRGGNLQQAVKAYKLALARCPRSASGNVALGLTHHMLRDPIQAIECYHVSLGIRPEDTIVNELLTMAMQDMALFAPARLG